MFEVELKIRVEDLDVIRKRLEMCNAVFQGRTREQDIYFNAPCRDFAVTDEALRVRYADKETALTYKGSKKREYHLKAREELSVGIDSGQEMEKILTRLGFTRVATVEKLREYYLLDEAVVALDQVEGLGSFIEIEMSGKSGAGNFQSVIKGIAEELGVSGEPILESYLELILSKR